MKPLPKPTNADQAEAWYGQYFEQGEKIQKESVTKYNYRFTGSFMTVGKYKLFELQPLKGDAAAEYCFLSFDKVNGVMLPDPYYRHRMKIKAMIPPPPKRNPANFQPAPPKKAEPAKKLEPAPPKKIDPHPQESGREEPRRALPKSKDQAAAMDGWAI